jgi:drug/metabolite transporter (DMT)-like permease
VILKGVLCGLAAAFCMSACYLFSRLFVTREGHDAARLFALSHVLMGAVCAATLPFLRSPDAPAMSRFLGPLFGASGFYLLGQVSLFQALRWTEASRVAPMLGLKILILALISTLFSSSAVSPAQWVGVFLSVVAAFALNQSGGRIPLPALAAVLVCCAGYCASDLSIKALMDRLEAVDELRRPFLAVAMTYVVTGAVGLGALPTLRRAPTRRQWIEATPVALSWLVAMVLLFACFKYLGVVFGNIVQSTRGIISILIGGLVARAGWVRLEQMVGAGVLARRIAAAALMSLAIALFVLEGRTD